MNSAIQITNTGDDVATRRVLRLALGTALSMAFSQIINWPTSFIAAVFTMLLLSVPLPAPTLKSGLKFILALVIPAYAGMLLLPVLQHARWAGILLVVLALHGTFYFTARGGSAIMGVFMTLGLAMVVSIGSVNASVMLVVVNGITIGAVAGISFVAIAHAMLPDLPPPQTAAGKPKPAPVAKPSLESARRNALRALVVVLPLVIFFLYSSSSISYMVVMIKVASMGQQANADVSRGMGRAQIGSTLWGGLGAIIAWYIMSIWPSLLIFCLLIGLAGLLYGSRIFKGPGMHADAGMWSYAYLTMIIVITPAVTNSQGTGNAEADFYTRLLLFVVIALYGTLSVTIFDAFWPKKSQPG